MRRLLVCLLFVAASTFGLLSGAGAQAPVSAWDEPTLSNPVDITITSSNYTTFGHLSQSQDYYFSCGGQTVAIPSKFHIWGGHNVVIEDCDFDITGSDWAGYFQNTTGTLWMHDVHFGGSQLTGGFQMQEPGTTTVVLRDVVFDTVHGSQNTNHAECIQTWSGPQRLLVDGLECPTTYQGLFLLPNQQDSTTTETTWDLRNVEVDGVGAYDLWVGNTNPSTIPTWNVQGVYDCGSGEPRDADGMSDNGQAWANVKPCPNPHPPAWLTGNPAGPVYGLDEPIVPIGGE